MLTSLVNTHPKLKENLRRAPCSNLMLKQATKHMVQPVCRSPLHNGVQCMDTQDSSRTGLANLKSLPKKKSSSRHALQVETAWTKPHEEPVNTRQATVFQLLAALGFSLVLFLFTTGEICHKIPSHNIRKISGLLYIWLILAGCQQDSRGNNFT